MDYLDFKFLHIVAANLFFGAGLASALGKIWADRSGSIEAIDAANRGIVWADWIFTVPSGIALPATGVWMVCQGSHSFADEWILWGIGLYGFAGLCWLPAAWLQIKMRRASAEALAKRSPLPPAYRRQALVWFLLGIPAFTAAILTFYVMVVRRLPWSPR